METLRSLNHVTLFNFLTLAFLLPLFNQLGYLVLEKYHSLSLAAGLLLVLCLIYGFAWLWLQGSFLTVQNILLATSHLLILSPLLFMRYYQIILARHPLATPLLTNIFEFRWKILPILATFYLLLLYWVFRTYQISRFSETNLLKKIQLSWDSSRQQSLYFFALLAIVFLLLVLRFLIFQKLLMLSPNLFILNTLLILNVFSGNCLFALLAQQLAGKTSIPPLGVHPPFLFLAAVFYLIILGVGFHRSLTTLPDLQPVFISHRGVSDKNGIQNTLTSLEDTHQNFSPDLVEIDVQETADHQLIVMHDFNLKKLTGIDQAVDQLTWSQIQKLTLKENGYQDKIALFSEYLNKANQLDQALLIELKATTKTKNTIISQLEKYRHALKKHQLQSMNLEVAEQLKKTFPNLRVGFILPFDFLGSPRNNLDFVNVEARTLSPALVTELKKEKKAIYVWSANQAAQTMTLKNLAVDGLLSDDLPVLQAKEDYRGRALVLFSLT